MRRIVRRTGPLGVFFLCFSLPIRPVGDQRPGRTRCQRKRRVPRDGASFCGGAPGISPRNPIRLKPVAGTPQSRRRRLRISVAVHVDSACGFERHRQWSTNSTVSAPFRPARIPNQRPGPSCYVGRTRRPVVPCPFGESGPRGRVTAATVVTGRPVACSFSITGRARPRWLQKTTFFMIGASPVVSVVPSALLALRGGPYPSAGTER